MLQLQKIRKEYTTGNLKQIALDSVSLNFRDSEFVSILGPSGSGKTTLLNIVGGLDRYDIGDLIINGRSTRDYKEKDWNTYRNNSIGFVFQNYNLIQHQTILANVELALTISGVSRAERKRRSLQALSQVGLEEQAHKKPNQMSGGQMQRVAIARALVNNPDILLADEPTGALDSETSIQVIELLSQVAKDRLVIMVTHNPELADKYSDRIVKLRDGKIVDDTNPYIDVDILNKKISMDDKTADKKVKKASMSFFTSLALSFNNLKTKKARTILTAFAGSIGIIGIALILSLSNGLNNYINDIQQNTMNSYPISIEEKCVDIANSFTEKHNDIFDETRPSRDEDGVYSNSSSLKSEAKLASKISYNDLASFKEYLESENCKINDYVGENGIVYSYNTEYSVYTYDESEELVNTDGSSFDTDDNNAQSEESESKFHSMISKTEASGTMTGENKNFGELISGVGGDVISKVVSDNYDVVYGNWPEKYDEVVLVLDENNEIELTTLYELGILPASEYSNIRKMLDDGQDVNIEEEKYSYEDICNQTFYLVPECDTYIENKNGTFTCIAENDLYMDEMLAKSIELKIVGVIKPNGNEDSVVINCSIGYTNELTKHIIEYTKNSDIVIAQQKSVDRNILTGALFEAANDEQKISDAVNYIKNMGVSEKASLYKEISETTDEIANMTEQQLAEQVDAYLENPEDSKMLEAYNYLVPSSTYDDNMTSFGYVDIDKPSIINIYADNFEDKEEIEELIMEYNRTVSEDKQIEYIDYVGTLMSSVTTIINVVSYVLMAFVAVSLIVSSIMIGIITYISVLERTKEIGILRAIGASKHNISQVFNAETFIIGLCAGLMGIIITLLALIPVNMVIHSLIGTDSVNASLPVLGSVILLVLSVLLTLIGGLIPSKKAAKKDPIVALHME